MGVLTKIIDWNRSPEGLLTIASLGIEKFRVANHRIEDNGLITGNVEVSEKEVNVQLISQNIINATGREFKNLLPLFSRIGEANPSSIESIYKLADFLNLPYSTRVKILMSENSYEMLELVHNFISPENT